MFSINFKINCLLKKILNYQMHYSAQGQDYNLLPFIVPGRLSSTSRIEWTPCNYLNDFTV